MVNMGGGFPTKYLKDVPTAQAYGKAIFGALRRHFGNQLPETIIEPGRGMVGNAGVIKAEVVLVSKKADTDALRWVFLDIGKFGGLAETMDEAIRYRSAPRATRMPWSPAFSPARPAIPPT
jgi:ornithine decarboxylase